MAGGIDLNTHVTRVGDQVRVTTPGGYVTNHPYADYQNIIGRLDQERSSNPSGWLATEQNPSRINVWLADQLRFPAQVAAQPAILNDTWEQWSAANPGKTVYDLANERTAAKQGFASALKAEAPVRSAQESAYNQAVHASNAARNKAGFNRFLSIAGPVAALGAGAILGPALLGGAGVGGTGLGAASTGAKFSLGSIFKGGLGSALGSALGAGPTWAPIVGGSLIGAGTGAITGGGKGALLGGLTGGLGGIFKGASPLINLGGDLGSIGNTFKTIGPDMVGLSNSGTDALLAAGGGSSLGSGLSSLFKTGLGGSGMSGLGNILSGISAMSSYEDMEKKQKEAQQKMLGTLSPYQSTGAAANRILSQELQSGALGGQFAPGDLTQDPGYQFRLAEGQKALERSLAARGMGESGAALKAAQQYGQGLADQTYNDAYNRWLNQQQQRYSMLSGQSGQGLNAAGAMNQSYGAIGDIASNSQLARDSLMSQLLSNVFRSFI